MKALKQIADSAKEALTESEKKCRLAEKEKKTQDKQISELKNQVDNIKDEIEQEKIIFEQKQREVQQKLAQEALANECKSDKVEDLKVENKGLRAIIVKTETQSEGLMHTIQEQNLSKREIKARNWELNKELQAERNAAEAKVEDLQEENSKLKKALQGSNDNCMDLTEQKDDATNELFYL